ncbi:hypothetical protein EDB80DRAFT_657834 [Ilyonectria destructans]|nr:hypothetical protein EDB80DRAFT_657834 [Ilyonectria destructans]
MPETPKRRGRPRKYGTQEEKARQDVIAKRARRARRRLRNSPAHKDIRFQVYVAQPTGALPPSSSQQNRSQSTNCLDVLADAASLSDRLSTSLPSTSNRITSNTSNTSNTIVTRNELSVLPSYEVAPYGGNDHSIGNNDTYETSDSQLHYDIVSDSSERESAMRSLPERISAPPSLDAHGLAENDPSGIREDENTSYQEEGGGDGLMSDLESQSDDVFEADSSSESDVSDTRSEMDIHDSGVPSGSDLYLAKCFLERNWDHLCDCQEEESVSWSEQPGLDLQDMADYWRNLGVRERSRDFHTL